MMDPETIKRIDELEKKVDYLLARLQPKHVVLENRPEPAVKPSVTTPAPGPLHDSRPAYRVSNQGDSLKSVNLLPILAVICFLMAAVFIVRLAIDSGWLTPLNQWGLLTMFGISLVCTGRFFQSVDKDYRSYLSAAGIVVLYIASYSSALYFNIFPPEGAHGLAAMVSLLCFSLFNFHRSELFPVLCAIGTYISPVLLAINNDLVFNGGFFLIWACVFSVIAAYLQTRTLPLVASYLGIGIFTSLYQGATAPGEIRLIIAVLATQFAAFAGGTYFYSIKNQSPLSKEAAISYLPVLLFFYGSVYYFLMRLNPDLAPWISLGFAGFLYFLFWMARKEIGNINSHNMVYSFLAVVLFHSGYLQIVPDSRKPWLLPIIILCNYIAEKRQDFPEISKIFRIMFSAIALLEFMKICFHLLTDTSLLNVVPAALTIVLGMFYYSRGSRYVQNAEGLFLGLVHLLSVLALYRIAFDLGSLAVSISWGFYSLVILLYGYVKRDSVICKSSLMVLGITSLKALLYDASQAASGVRIFTLIVTGVVLYGAGYMFKEISAWKKEA